MGIVFSRAQAIGSEVTTHVTNESETMSEIKACSEGASEEATEKSHDAILSREREMIAFREQLAMKREQRKDILARHKAEKENLRKSLEIEQKARRDLSEENKLLRELLLKNNIDVDFSLQEKEENDIHETIKNLREEFEVLKDNNKRLRRELADSNLSLQEANSDITNLQCQFLESTKQISALKEVVTVSKTMIKLREEQLNELKSKLNEIEKSLADREANMLSTDLRQEYERQLQNIRTIRSLYEERARLAEVTRVNLLRELEEEKLKNVTEINKSKELAEKVAELEFKLEEMTETIENKDSLINTCQNETRGLKAEMTAINMLFSQVLLGYKNNQNLDTLVHRLEENHGLLLQMAELENGSEASSALPKLLLELVTQVDEQNIIIENDNGEESDIVPVIIQRGNSNETVEDTKPVTDTCLTSLNPEEIVKSLPKVWKVLMELLSHQNVPETNAAEKTTTCYKSVETTSGPVLVPSVSQTYIRLKDLIVEKLALIKEMNRMKQLNGHLETRLQEQERRLCLVTSELSKTWHVVGRLRRHHHQLHTHEKILKYELQQKRKLLNDLKEELEYCREKWEQAREKNSQSEKDWKKLRAEFTSRRTKVNSPFNHSGESGYSDERQTDTSESNDESEYVNEPPIKCKKKLYKIFDVVDPSTDINLAAEREDPISDLIDVADLPLDGQETEEHLESRILSSQNESEDVSISESCVSDSVSKFEKSINDNEKECELDINSGTEGNDCNIVGDTCSKEEKAYKSNLEETRNSTDNNETENDDLSNTKLFLNNTNEPTCSFSKITNVDQRNNISVPKIDPAAIMESIKRQNERLAKKDIKLRDLERNSAALLNKSQGTAALSEQLNSTLDHLLNRPSPSLESAQVIKNNATVTNESVEQRNEESPLRNEKLDSSGNAALLGTTNKEEGEEQNDGDQNSCSITTISDSISEPSVSKLDVDHEARFAARDERLKRLEEQTKCLVNKVNNTKTKRIKLKYKLEELHNIYGSENSRAGTPSGETEEEENNEDGEGEREEENNE